MDDEGKRLLAETWFVPGKPRPHSEESFMAAARELTDLIDEYVEKHGIGVVVGFAAPKSENPQVAYEGAFVLCHPPLARLALKRLGEAVQAATMIAASNEQNKN